MNIVFKSLLDLKKSPHFWYETINATFQQFSFSPLNLCKYVLKVEDCNFEVVIIVYVDDITTLSDGLDRINWANKEPIYLVRMPDLGKI